MELLSEKKAIRERREARLKHSQCKHSAPLSAALGQRGFSPSMTHTQRECHQIPAHLTMMARHLQQRCAKISFFSKAFLDLTGLQQGMTEFASWSLQEVQSSC